MDDKEENYEQTDNNKKLSMRNIVLVGFMGSGKTIIGKLLAENLGMSFADVDDIIEKESGMSVQQIFLKLGEDKFRRMESETFDKLLESDSTVIAAGGGTFENEDLREKAKERATTIWLDCSFENILSRVESLKENRPILMNNSVDELRHLYMTRNKHYALCNKRIHVNGKSPEVIVRDIIRFWNHE